MNVTIKGIFLKCEITKDKEGNDVSVTSIYSGDEVVKVRGLLVNNGSAKIGCEISANCELKLKEFDGRKYLSINFVKEGDV